MITLILPYYNAPQMLRRQLDEVARYPGTIKTIVVDDGSPVKAQGVFKKGDRASLYRITEDVAWNRGQARNLGAYVADTEWIIQVDIDHILPVACAERLVKLDLQNHWYRFPRFRVGKADYTRKKDFIDPNIEYGRIHPHIDSYLIPRKMYWMTGGYDERYSGCLGGGSPFLSRLTKQFGEPLMLPDDIFLEVHTSSSVQDASVSELSRDTAEYQRRRALYGDSKPVSILNYPWEKVL
jgi:glycosyltransferase involved in cell wall biosynthesis